MLLEHLQFQILTQNTLTHTTDCSPFPPAGEISTDSEEIQNIQSIQVGEIRDAGQLVCSSSMRTLFVQFFQRSFPLFVVQLSWSDIKLGQSDMYFNSIGGSQNHSAPVTELFLVSYFPPGICRKYILVFVLWEMNKFLVHHVITNWNCLILETQQKPKHTLQRIIGCSYCYCIVLHLSGISLRNEITKLAFRNLALLIEDFTDLQSCYVLHIVTWHVIELIWTWNLSS
jgi:hypothetical protein